MKVRVTFQRFYCEDCHDWTEVDPYKATTDDPTCGRCGEAYKCGECGFEINWRGECQRPDETADGTPEPVCPSRIKKGS